MSVLEFLRTSSPSMRVFRMIAAATAASTMLVAVAPCGAARATGQDSGSGPSGDQPAPDAGNPLSSDQLNREYQALSPAARAALVDQLRGKGIDGLNTMSESDARAAFAGLPPDVRAQIQAKWDALSDEQRIALKKMGPAALKELVASQMKEIMKQSVSPVVKPVEQVVAKVQSAVQSAKTIMEKGRAYVQGLIAKLKGQDDGQAEVQARQ